MNKTILILVSAFCLFAAATTQVFAHHGWRWTTGDNIELIGVIKSVRLGNPHGRLSVDAEGDVWMVGVEIKIIGEPSADINERRLKAEKLYLGKREFILYPDRD